jgi:protein SCO1/2
MIGMIGTIGKIGKIGMIGRACAVALAATAVLAGGAIAEEVPPALRDVGIDQRLNHTVPLDLSFRDETGDVAPLSRYIAERPVVLALVYYECPMLCTLVLNGLVSSLKAMSLNAGEDFDVVAVSIDPTETPEMAAAKKETYLHAYRRPGAAEGFHFLTGDDASIRRLADAVGFRYRYDEASGEYAHSAGIAVLTPSGRIARYFYGVEYSPRDLRLGLVEAADERIGSAIDQLMLFCFRYDVASGKYSAAVLNLVRLGGVLTVAAFGAFVIASRSRETRLRAAKQA